MTITEQIRLKLKTVDGNCAEVRRIIAANLTGNRPYKNAPLVIDSLAVDIRRILREICELDGENEE